MGELKDESRRISRYEKIWGLGSKHALRQSFWFGKVSGIMRDEKKFAKNYGAF